MFAKKEARMLTIAESKPEGREELNRAHAARQAAGIALEKARSASGSARLLLADSVRQSEDVEAVEMREATSRFEEMKASLLAGSLPSIAAGDKGRARISAAAFGVRRQAAEAVVADLAGDERAAEVDLERANEAVAAAIRSLVKAEAEHLAERWTEAEAEARKIRIRLGRDGDPASRLPGFSQKLGRAFYANGADEHFGHGESEIAREPWTRFGADLLSDPNAKLDFGGADRALDAALKERKAHRQAEAAFVERMRVSPTSNVSYRTPS
jgi:hypothetical protein